MKLAEALALRADAQQRLEQLKERAVAAARYQEGEAPAEPADELITSAHTAITELQVLVSRINHTNSHTELVAGVTVTDAIAERDAIKANIAFLTAVANAASATGRGYGAWRQMRSELALRTDLDVPALRRDIDKLARQYRKLDGQIQQANWNTELIEH